MKENGFYKIKQDYIDFINNQVGGVYRDNKVRPIFCCVEDKYNKGLFWGIPTSDYSHRDEKQIQRIEDLCKLDYSKDIRGCYYHIGTTNRKAIFRVSNCLPLSDCYIDEPYNSLGTQLFMKNPSDIMIIRKKLARILFDENIHPNKYEQRISDIISHPLFVIH